MSSPFSFGKEGERMNDLIKHKLKLLPDQPGCYLMHNEADEIIYVGKAKSLKNRVRSYFTGEHNEKTKRLVAELVDFEYIVTSSENEALALEMNLIQENQPKYNILLKDNRSYPYLKITKERYPQLKITRKVQEDQAEYFGPYPDIQAAKETKKILDRLYPLRKCGPNEKKPCFYHHLDQCSCPYYFQLDPKEYQKEVQKVRHFLQGDMDPVAERLEQKMNQAAAKQEYEMAAEYRDEWKAILKMKEEQKVTHAEDIDRDIVGYAVRQGKIGIQIFHIRHGKMIQRDMDSFYSIDSVEETVLTYLLQFYQQNLVPKEILVPVSLDIDALQQWIPTTIRVPKRGEKHSFVQLACKNAAKQLQDEWELQDKKIQRQKRGWDQLAEKLHLPFLHRLESIDNSHWQGKDNVSGLVVYIDGRKAPKQYRKFKIKESQGDDYRAMKEVVYRRYSRLQKEGEPLPDLLLVDGGKIQVEAAKEVLKEQLGLYIPVAGMVKDEHHQTRALLYGDPLQEIPLQDAREAFHLLEEIQQEVHRYALHFHQKTRRKSGLQSVLQEIPGIGVKRRQQLLSHFSDLSEMKNASVEDFMQIGIPKNVAHNVYDFFHRKDDKPSKM